jgi:glycyl-tRNA synthetase beta chain
VDRFFDEVLVMADDEALRKNRLALLKKLASLFMGIADFSKIVTEGA